MGGRGSHFLWLLLMVMMVVEVVVRLIGRDIYRYDLYRSHLPIYYGKITEIPIILVLVMLLYSLWMISSARYQVLIIHISGRRSLRFSHT